MDTPGNEDMEVMYGLSHVIYGDYPVVLAMFGSEPLNRTKNRRTEPHRTAIEGSVLGSAT